MRPTLLIALAMSIGMMSTPAAAEITILAELETAPTIVIVQEAPTVSEKRIEVSELGPVGRFLIRRITRRALSDRVRILNRLSERPRIRRSDQVCSGCNR